MFITTLPLSNPNFWKQEFLVILFFCFEKHQNKNQKGESIAFVNHEKVCKYAIVKILKKKFEVRDEMCSLSIINF